MQAKYAIKVQAIRSKTQAPRFYVNFPLPLAAAIGLTAGESVEWELLARGELHLVRPHPAPPAGQPAPRFPALNPRQTVAATPPRRNSPGTSKTGPDVGVLSPILHGTMKYPG